MPGNLYLNLHYWLGIRDIDIIDINKSIYFLLNVWDWAFYAYKIGICGALVSYYRINWDICEKTYGI